MNKLTLEFIGNQFKREGYELLSGEYIEAHGKLDYVCPNNHNHNITWSDFKTGNRCPFCSGKAKKTIEFIKQEFKKEHYKLLTKEYKNAHKKLDYICSNGHKHFITWGSWSQGRRCPYCANRPPIDINYIRAEFKNENYMLISNKYINSHNELKYICPNGHRNSIRWNNWRVGKRCSTCHNLNCIAENHPSWKGGISCEPYCQNWTKEFKDFIKERDGNRCLNPDCWEISNKLCVHHIDYNKKNCEPENLITLCASCNSRANKDREWHESWYKAIVWTRYLKGKGEMNNVNFVEW